MKQLIIAYLPLCILAALASGVRQGRLEQTADKFISGFFEEFLGEEFSQKLSECTSEIAEDIVQMTSEIDDIHENGADPGNVVGIVSIVMEWPTTLITCIESFSEMKEGFEQFKTWAAQFEDGRKATQVITSRALSNMGEIIDLIDEMYYAVHDEDWYDAGESLAEMITIVMGSVDSDVSEELSCWLGATGRGVGKMRSKCPAGEERKGRLCYPICKDGYKGRGPMCWQQCPDGWRNDGLYCKKPKGLGWKDECPEGMTNIGISCRKDRYGRGAGHSPDCQDDEIQAGLLCYPPCSDPNAKGIGPVCWDRCPAGKTRCGALCLGENEKCFEYVMEVAVNAMEVVSEAFRGNFEQVAIEAGELVGNFNYPRCKDLTRWDCEKKGGCPEIVEVIENQIDEVLPTSEEMQVDLDQETVSNAESTEAHQSITEVEDPTVEEEASNAAVEEATANAAAEEAAAKAAAAQAAAKAAAAKAAAAEAAALEAQAKAAAAEAAAKAAAARAKAEAAMAEAAKAFQSIEDKGETLV